jgi:hypothetical protein
MGAFDSALTNLEISINMNDFKIKDRTKSGKHPNKKAERVGKAIGGGVAALLATWAVVNSWNPTGWIAGLVATGVASSVGAAFGGKIGEQFESEEEIITVVGDTKEEVMSSLKSEFRKLCRIQLNAMKNTLDKNYLKPINDYASGLLSELIYIQKSIEEGLK